MMTIHTCNGNHNEKVKINIVNISAGCMDADTMGRACESLGAVAADIRITTANSENLDDDKESFMDVIESTRCAHIVILKVHGDPSYFKKIDRLKSAVRNRGIPMFVECNSPEVQKEFRDWFPFPDEDYKKVSGFIELGGEKNSIGLLYWVCSRIGNMPVDVPVLDVPPAQGLYHPDPGRVADEREYLDSLDPSKPTVGILFHQKYWKENNIDNIQELVRSLERAGCNTIPVFCITTPSEVSGSIGIVGTIERYFIDGCRPRIGSVVVCMGFSQLSMANPAEVDLEEGAYNFFNDLNVAVLQATSILKSRERWEEDTVGMGPVEISTFVIWPEFDGQIITVPLQFMEKDERGNYRNKFVPDRVERISSLAMRWAVLKRKAKSSIKAVIMLNMYPPSNDRLGGAGGLDTFESIRRQLTLMKHEGYAVDHIPESSQEIVDELMAGLTNDLEWVPVEEIPGRAHDLVHVDDYMKWFDSIPGAPREAMCRNWGDPPGDITTYRDKLVIPGVLNGNVFIGIQPNRGHHAHAEQLYHSTDVVMPHQYLAYYRWIRDVFKADLIIHMGTHGTLEWLPGKGNGLSRDCYPDVVLDTMPNVYPYIIDDPGEGMEAKRRTNSALVGYMVAAMARAEEYDGIAVLNSALQSFLNTEATGQPEKSKDTASLIYETIKKESMFKELNLCENATIEDVMTNAELIFDYISELKDALIKDGLHILGSPPEGARMEEMVYCMTRLRNGDIPALRDSVAIAMGHDIDALLGSPSTVGHGGKLNGAILDEIDGVAQTLIGEFHRCGFDKAMCASAAERIIGQGFASAMPTIKFICNRLYPGIMGISNELDSLLNGSNGGYIPPGPSGSPTRGNAHLLPTGTNYYSIDPDSVPNDACWKIGCKMADDMIRRHVEEVGRYPENVGIIVWATDTMKTGGDDIAYILYLMGLKPKWSTYGGRVVGLEVIPIDVLGRPRMDVTLRISGKFRDSFPNRVNLIDEGVETIASLDEKDEDNFLRKHLQKDISRYISEGLSKDDAESRSMIRIFGDPPGQHGCGTGILIESSKWNTLEDLAQIYTTWGSYAYGRRWKGEKMTEEFKRRMSSLDVTVKNHNDREFDLLDIDDDYEVLGGLNAVVRAYGGHKPMSFMGDSSDPDRLKLRTLEEETAYVMRSRVLNPKWLEGLKPHGFRGAMELSKLTEYMLGWDATSDNIEPWMYQAVTEKFVLAQETREWIEQNNPYALKEMVEDLLEAIDRDLWDAPDDIRDRLRELYLEAEGSLEDLGATGVKGR